MWLPCGVSKSTYAQDMAVIHTRTQWGLLVLLLAFLCALPFLLNSLWLGIVIHITIILIAVLGLHILTGLCGQISLGQAAFVGVAAYTSTLLCATLHFPLAISIVCAALFTGLFGIVFGLPALRIKGFYLAMSTLAAQLIIVYLFIHLPFAGGSKGLFVPTPRFLESKINLYFVIMGTAILAIAFAKNISRTKLGRIFVAIRDNDLAAEVIGIRLSYYKLLAFFICSLYAGVAGALYSLYIGHINYEHFTLMDSVWYLGMLVVGGLGSTSGVVFGVIFINLLSKGTSLLASQMPALSPQLASTLGIIVFGLAIILFLIFEPRGIAHRWEIFKNSYRIWPFSY